MAFGFPTFQMEASNNLCWDHFQFREFQTMHSDEGGTHFAFNSFSRYHSNDNSWDYPKITEVSGYPVELELGSSDFVLFGDGAMGWYNNGPGDTKGPIKAGIYLSNQQNFGIGLDNPDMKLHVAGSVRVGVTSGGDGRLFLSGGTDVSEVDDANNTDELFLERHNQASNVTHLRINIGDDGKVDGTGVAEDKVSFGCYTWDGSHDWREAVGIYSNGSIYARKVKVTLDAYPDYVFSPGYKIRSLEETEAFIKANQHLPEMPSACEIEQNGADLGELHKAMLKQLEELTLQVIALKKEVEVLKTKK
jgi:hypothetical protein